MIGPASVPPSRPTYSTRPRGFVMQRTVGGTDPDTLRLWQRNMAVACMTIIRPEYGLTVRDA